jgi:hypothetical protein
MARPVTKDWAKAKDLYCNGMTAEQVAKAIDASVLTVRKRAHREDWSRQRALTAAGARLIEPSHITEWLNTRLSGWMRGITQFLERTTDSANRLHSPATRQDLKTDAAVLRDLVTAGRATFGLDKQQPTESKLLAPTVQVGITLVNQPQAQPSMDDSKVIDVDSQAVTGSSSMTDNHNAGEKDPLDADDVASATGRDLSSPDL